MPLTRGSKCCLRDSFGGDRNSNNYPANWSVIDGATPIGINCKIEPRVTRPRGIKKKKWLVLIA
jgi:hypothetical protein